MTGQDAQTEKKLERESDSANRRPEGALQEANEGRENLVAQQKARTAEIRATGRTGVTSDFGKVTIDGLDEPAGKSQRGSRGSGDAQAATESTGSSTEAPAARSDGQSEAPTSPDAGATGGGGDVSGATSNLQGSDGALDDFDPGTVRYAQDGPESAGGDGQGNDPGATTQTENQRERTTWPNGVERVQSQDHSTGYVRTPPGIDQNGRPSDSNVPMEHHWGPNPQDNYDFRRNALGQDEIQRPPGSGEWQDVTNDVEFQRTRVSEAASERMTPDEAAQFRSDQAQFEQRRSQMEASYRQQYEQDGLGNAEQRARDRANEEIAGTYRETTGLLQAQDNPQLRDSRGQVITQSNRNQLARDVMGHAADPTSVEQGGYDTCGAAASEAQTYTHSPSQAARLVREVSTTGTYHPTDGGTPVQVDPSSLRATPDTRNSETANSSDRSHASQIFQVTAVNVAYDRRDRIPGTPRDEYRQNQPREDDNGERVYTSPGGSEEARDTEGRLLRRSDLGRQDVERMNSAISGQSATVVDHENVGSQEEFQNRLQQAQQRGEYPLLVGVDTRDPVWQEDIEQTGARPGPHLMRVTGYHPEDRPPTVEVDNQWGEQRDRRRIPVSDFHRSVRRPSATAATPQAQTG